MANLNEVIMNVAKLYEMSYPNVEFDTSGLRSCRNFLSTEAQMVVFVNIVANAIEALDPKKASKVKIEVRSMILHNLNACVEVADNGCGIP